ncbi:MAG: nitronate monooxygenase, partial [Rikenellaceae bacterium]
TRPKTCPQHCIRTCDINKSPYCIMHALSYALKGNFNHGYAFAGVNAYRAEKITTVKEIFKTLMEEFDVAVSKK